MARFKRVLEQRLLLPILVGSFPVLALASNNAREIALDDALRPLVLAWLGAGLIYLVMWALRRDSDRAALATAWVLLLFFSYGHAYGLLKEVHLLAEPLGRHRYLLPLSLALTLLVFWLVFSRPRGRSDVFHLLNIAALVLVIAPSARLTASALLANDLDNLSPDQPSASAGLTAPSGEALPDIYYIVLDSYGRSDVLKNTYGYDNSEFLAELKDLGFYVATESVSNYSYTILSLASSLNYAYLGDLGIGLDRDQAARDWYALGPLIENSRVRRDLSSIGYSMVAFESGYEPTRVENADLYLSPARQGPFAALSAITPLENLLIETTMLKILVDTNTIFTEAISPHARHREMILFQLRSLRQLPELQGPKFVFAHIMAPHEPYVFGPQGQPRTPEEIFTLGDRNAPGTEGTDRRGFVDQTIFIEDEIVDVIQEILEGSATPPIIILQGDHGLPIGDVSPGERMAILNAYYLPHNAEEQLYPEISPVNTFRVILGSVFGADLQLLTDEAYFSRYPDLFDTRKVDPTE